MVDIHDKITHINALLTNHEQTQRDLTRCPQPITDIINHLKATLITTPQTEIYSHILKIYEEEYEDPSILETFNQMISATPLLPSDRTQPYISPQHLLPLITNIITEIRLYIDNFVLPPERPTQPTQPTQSTQSTQPLSYSYPILGGAGGRL